MAATYRQLHDYITGGISATTILHVADGAYIPNDPGNREWVEYQVWLAAGGVPDAPDGTGGNDPPEPAT